MIAKLQFKCLHLRCVVLVALLLLLLQTYLGSSTASAVAAVASSAAVAPQPPRHKPVYHNYKMHKDESRVRFRTKNARQGRSNEGCGRQVQDQCRWTSRSCYFSRYYTRSQPPRVPKFKVGSTVAEMNKIVIAFYNSSAYEVNLRSRSASSKKRAREFTFQECSNGGKEGGKWIPTEETKEKMRIDKLCVPRSKKFSENQKNNNYAALKGRKNKQQQPCAVSGSFSGAASLVRR